MKLASNYTLEVLKNTQKKYVFCVIRVAQREVKYYAEQDKAHFTHRWLQPEHWAAFDSKLHELSASNKIKNLSRTLNIDLIDFVHLKIKKSKIPVDLLCGTVTDLEITPKDVFAAIECEIEYSQIKPDQNNVCSGGKRRNPEIVEHKEKQRKEESSISPTPDNLSPPKQEQNHDPNYDNNKVVKSPPKHTKQKSKGNHENFLNQISISDNSSNQLQKQKKQMDNVEDSSISSDESTEENNFGKALAVLSGTLNKQTLNYDSNNSKRLRRSISAPSNISKEKKKSSLNTPVAPKAISHQSKAIAKKKRPHRNPLDCQENLAMSEWLIKKSSLVNRNQSKNSGEIGSMNPPESVDKELASSGESQLFSSQNSKREEKDEYIKMAKARTNYNREVAKLLQDLTPKSPKKTKNLDLMDMSANDILKTFKKYQPQLEKLFEKFKSFPKVKQNNGVDHFLVMGLLRNATQLVMMNELSEHYEKNREGLPKYGELFSMVLMPEWILSIFMNRHGMTREEAINHIKAQNAYKAHMQCEIKMDDTLLP